MGKKSNRKDKRQASLQSTISEPSHKHVKLVLLTLYLVSVAVRFILSILFRHGATILIDESLYFNIAKSLALEGTIAFRSQPVPYLFVFYPLLLVPIYLAKLPFDIYRAIQLYNSILMASVVFPTYLFAKEFTNNDCKALLSSVITLLIPDMAMSGFLMTECVIWPLSIWVFFFAYKLYCIEDGKIKNAVLTGVFTALLFWTKPGSMAAGVAILVFAAVWSLVKKDKVFLKASLAGIGVAVGMIAFFYLLYVFVFGYDMSILGLYDKQLTKVDLKWILAVLETSLLQIMLLAIASCGIFAMAPFALIKEYPEKQKGFILATAAGIFASVIGTAALVDMYSWNGSFTNMQLHLRYIAMYVPILFVFSLQIAERKRKVGKKLIISVAALAVLVIIPGARVGSVFGESTCIDSIALSGFMRTPHMSSVLGIFLSIVLSVFLVFITIELGNGISTGLKKFCTMFFIGFLIINNFAAYKIINDIQIDPVYSVDASEMNVMIEKEEKPVLGITLKHYNDINTCLLETHIRKPMQQVTIENIISEALQTGGVYVPFVPVDQAPNRQNHVTPDTDTFLLGATIAEHLELCNCTDSETTSNGVYTLIHIQEGERWVDSMLYGLNQNRLANGEDAQLFIFDDSRFINNQTTLRVTAGAKDEGVVLRVTNNDSVTEFPLTSENADYELEINPGSIILSAEGGDITLTTYTTGK